MGSDLELVGRERALSSLREAFARACAGRGGLVLVRGEPGIGKSALAQQIGREAEERGAALVLGRAWELAEAPPYFPIWPCLRALGMAPPEPGDSNAFRLWERTLEALAEHASLRVIVWVIEDIHAADLLTLDLLTFLAQPLAALRVLLIATARDRDPAITERAGRRLERMARDGLDLRLEPLAAEQVAELAARVVGHRVPHAALQQLAALSGGNPLFVVECARALREAGAISGVPGSVRQVVLDRVALLPQATRRALEAGAILGRAASAGTIARMLGELPARVIDALLPALKAGIISEPRPGHLLFTHILVRDAIEDALTPSLRAELHGRAENALSSLGDQPEVLVERARHALGAAEPSAQALTLGRRATSSLEAQGAFDRAHAMLQRVLDAEYGWLGIATDPDERLHLARLAQAAGRYAEARRICLEVFAWARQNDDARVLAQAALMQGADLRPGTVDRTLVANLEQAYAALGGVTSALGCRVLARLAAALQPAADPARPIALAHEAIAGARALGDDALLLDVADTAGAALVDYAPNEERRALQAEVLERAERAGDAPKALRALARLALDLAECGDISGFERGVERVLELASGLGHPRDRWRALLLGSMRALAHGQVQIANRFVVEVQQLAELTDDPALALSLNAHIGQAARLLHREDELRRTLEYLNLPMADVPQPSLISGVLRIAVLTRLEDRDAVRKALAELDDYQRAGAGLELFFGALLAEAYAFVGATDECRKMRALFEARTARHVVSGHVPMTYEGSVLRLLGLLDSALGAHPAAERGLRAALALAEADGYALWQAQLHYELGNALALAGRARDAEPEWRAAAELAQHIGMPGLVERALKKGTHSSAAIAALSAEPTTAAFSLVCEGDTWRVEQGNRSVRVRDSRGMKMLARLVEHRGEEIHVLVLGSETSGANLSEAPKGAAIEALDARARSEYRERLAELQAAIDEAERAADLGRLERFKSEQQLLESELARAFGLGGKARGSGSPSERARVNVQRRLKDAVARIGDADASLGRFVERALRTGIYCRFGL